MENQDQQTLTSHFSYDAPSPPPDETFAYTFPNQTNVSYNNEVYNFVLHIQIKISILNIFFF